MPYLNCGDSAIIPFESGDSVDSRGFCFFCGEFWASGDLIYFCESCDSGESDDFGRFGEISDFGEFDDSGEFGDFGESGDSGEFGESGDSGDFGDLVNPVILVNMVKIW